MGSASFSLPILSALLEQGPRLDDPVDVVGVVTQPDRPAGRGRKLTPNPVALAADELDIPLLKPRRLRSADALAALAALDPDVAVVAAYGQILPQAALDIPAHGCLNLHPSLLPRHRGPSPMVATILSGDEITGTTLMLMSDRMDAGPIVDRRTAAMDERESAGDLEARLSEVSAAMLLEDLPRWVRGWMTLRPQDESEATYSHLLNKADARVDWTLPAIEIARMVRAFDPWPVAHASWEDKAIRLYGARVAPGDALPGQVESLVEGALAVGTGSGVVLIDELQLAGARRLPASEFVNGHAALLGSRLE